MPNNAPEEPTKLRSRSRKVPITGVMRARQLYLTPTKDQASTFKEWMGAARWCYNQCIHDITHSEPRTKVSWMDYRDKYATNNATTPGWLTTIPKDIRAGACMEACDAFKTAAKKVRSGMITHFKLSFRNKKKMTSESIVIPKTSVQYIEDRNPSNAKKGCQMGVRLYPRRVKTPICIRDKRKTVDAVLSKLDFDVKVVYKRLEQRFYLSVPFEVQRPTARAESQGESMRFVAVDPGVRTFMTYYSPMGKWGKLCDGEFKRIQSLCVWLDRLQSVIDKAKAAQPQIPDWLPKRKLVRRERAWHRAIVRIRNLITEAHWKVARFLTAQFDVIYIPTFETSQMTNRRSRKIDSKTARNMLTWRHYDFRQKLKMKAEERGCTVIECTEEYTSKTCGNCGHIKHNLGSAKIYTCTQCGLQLDRDLHAARNIFLMNHCRNLLV